MSKDKDSSSPAPIGGIQAHFLAALPRMEDTLRYLLRNVRPASRADELHADALGLLWRYWLSVTESGRQPADMVGPLVFRAVQAVKNGRSVVGQERSRSVTSPVAPTRERFVRHSWPDDGPADRPLDWFDTVAIRASDRPAETAAFTLDFEDWLSQLPDRWERIAKELATGTRTMDVARTFGLSDGRVSQLRAALADSWDCFQAGWSS